MPAELRLALVPGCTILEDSPARLRFEAPAEPVSVHEPPAGVREALLRLTGAGAAEGELRRIVMEADGYQALPDLYRAILALHDRQRLSHRVWSERAVLASSIPIADSYRFEVDELPADRRFRISRFAHVRREDASWIVESPLSDARVVLHDPRASELLFRSVEPIAGRSGTAADAVLLALFGHARLLTEVDENGETEEDADRGLAPWEFHDLLFHSRSRTGRHANPYGGTFRLRGTREPLPAFKPAAAAPTIELFRPHDGRLERDAPFMQVLEQRRSERTQGSPPITSEQLGEFLFRVARSRGRRQGEDYETSQRLYPGGGAAYELEVYPLIQSCPGLDPGLYHYRPAEHVLQRVCHPGPETERLLAGAAHAARSPEPQVLFLLAARFQRVSWKYSSVAYATILKDVGVLYQTMYLAAAAMGLAACALGGGNSDLFARAAGTAYYEETTVGEFMLGSRAESGG